MSSCAYIGKTEDSKPKSIICERCGAELNQEPVKYKVDNVKSVSDLFALTSKIEDDIVKHREHQKIKGQRVTTNVRGY